MGEFRMRHYEQLGTFDPTFYREQAGVYPIEPYQIGKIPVVLVHGICSGPRVWRPLLDALHTNLELRTAYQFWVVLYPSGYPLPLAALSIRQSLREIRQQLDPANADPALSEIVILGKSTGGQVTRMLIASSGDSLWNAIFTRPVNQITVTADLREKLTQTFFFEPEPYIRRVIFVTTAHRGSKLGAQRWVRSSIELIRWHNPLISAWAELEANNGQMLFWPCFRDHPLNAADGLEANNPMLLALDRQPIASGIPYHSIIANSRHSATAGMIHDGVVNYESAHLDGAASERIVTDGHACEDNAEFIREVGRILHAHLAQRRLGSSDSSCGQRISITQP